MVQVLCRVPFEIIADRHDPKYFDYVLLDDTAAPISKYLGQTYKNALPQSEKLFTKAELEV